MKTAYHFVFLSIIMLNSVNRVTAQEVPETLPPVFQIGEFTERYENLHLHHINLMEVCDDNIELAYDHWMHMLDAMDQLSEELNIDLRGTKLWLHVFWDQEGNIRHLAYHPKPTSKFVEINILTAFFKNFVRNYQMPLQSEMRFYSLRKCPVSDACNTIGVQIIKG